jgi:hypothetical protein
MSMADGDNNIDYEIDEFLKKIVNNMKQIPNNEDEIDDSFNEFVANTVEYSLKGDKKIPYFPCDTCKKKQVLIDQYHKICHREYIPPYIDPDCRDYKIALVIERIDAQIVERAFKYLIFRTSINEIVERIDDPEWRMQAESILRVKGYGAFIEKEFGKLGKDQIIQMLFDINFYYFDCDSRRTLKEAECLCMLKYYIVLSLRDRVKEGLFKIAKLIEIELEYKITVIESEIRYFIKCILQEIVITPLPATNYNITFFNKIGSLTELMKIFNGIDAGRHDERSDFRHIRNTVERYEKVVRTSFDILNKKIKQLEELLSQRKFIVGVTGVCEKQGVLSSGESVGPSVVIPPQPVIVLNPNSK